MLIGRLENENLREVAVETRVLLVLGRVHSGVVRNGEYQSAVRAGDRRVDKRVRRDIQTDVLHRH